MVNIYPAHCLPMLLRAKGIRDFMILVICGNEIQHDRAAFEDLELASVPIFVGQCRNTAVGVDFEEPWLLLFVLAEVKSHDLEKNDVSGD